MKIQVDNGTHNIKIPLPSSLIFSDLSAFITYKAIKNVIIKKDEAEVFDQKSKETVKTLIKCGYKALKETKKKYPQFILVDIESADGEKILITL